MHVTAHRLKEVRQWKKQSQSEFAKSFGISLRSYQYYESGDRALPIDLLRTLADMGINIHWFITGNGDMLIEGDDQAEGEKLKAEYWQSRHHLLETSVKVARQRVINKIGREEADKAFKEILQTQQEGVQLETKEKS